MHRIGRSILVGLALFFLLLPGGAHASYNPFDFSSGANVVDNDKRKRPHPEEVLDSNDPAGGKQSSQDAPRRITLEEHFWGPDYRKRHINIDDAGNVSLEEDFYGPEAGFDAPQSRRSLEEQTLSTGLFHTCAITYRPGVEGSCGEHPCGPVQCFGHDEFGQASPPPGVVFDQISAGGFHTCGLKAGGKIACWGDIDHPPASQELLSSEELDNYKHAQRMQRMEQSGAHFASSEPVAGGDYYVQLTSGLKYVQLSSGLKHSCAISRDREVHCWGRNDFGESRPPKGSFFQISAGHSFTCGLRPSRKVECWGKNSHSPPSFPEHRFRQISASLGGDHACGVLDDGGIVCWGGNGRGQSDRQEGNYLQVSAGTRTTCAIRDDSDPENSSNDHGSDTDGSNATSIHCWGGRAAAVLDHLEAEREQQQSKDGRSHHQISLGQDHACVLTKSASESSPDTPKTSLECWWMAGSDFDAHRVPAGLEMVA